VKECKPLPSTIGVHGKDSATSRSAAVAPDVNTTAYSPTGALKCCKVALRASSTAADQGLAEHQRVAYDSINVGLQCGGGGAGGGRAARGAGGGGGGRGRRFEEDG